MFSAFHNETGELSIWPPEFFLPILGDDETLIEVPGRACHDPISTVWDKDQRAFVDPRFLTPAETVALYTATEKARIFTSTEPNVRALLTALQFSSGVAVGSTEHQQGTALIAGLGLLDSPERVARILAGMPPGPDESEGEMDA